MPSDLKAHLAKRCAVVDKALEVFLTKAHVMPPVIHEAMRYSVFAGGKRLRPILCLEAAAVCGAKEAAVMPTACALEMIHTYSLVHDDLPAMDNDDLRRGQPTCHKKFGEAVAILAGDALLTHGFRIIAQNAREKGVKPAAVVAVIERVAEAVGSEGMIGGQIVDLEMEGAERVMSDAARAFSTTNQKHEGLEYIHHHKTGALIRASLDAGALLAGGSAKQRQALDTYGAAIGLAFQIADDILDVIGDKRLLGKRGSDADNNKLTYVALYGLESSKEKAREEIHKAKSALKIFSKNKHALILSDLADYVVDRTH
jgi:geranylgeranyl diphosphate synthase type II